MGYKDFGCTRVKLHGLSARTFRYVNNDMTSSSFECILASKGYHSNDDCHGDRTSLADKKAYCYGDICLEYKNPLFRYGSNRSELTIEEASG